VDAFIKKSNDEMRLYFEQAQSLIGLPPASIEKDFWVCWTLWKLFNLPEWGKHLVFKGGTSLSKCWGLIARFSEDIDIVINRDCLGFEGEKSPEKAKSIKQRQNRLKELKKACRYYIQSELKPAIEQCFKEALPSKIKWSLAIDEDDKEGQTLLFKYPGILTGKPTCLQPQVKIELGARSDTWPTDSPMIKPYLGEAFPALAIDKFIVKAVAPERTFWEKAMLLHEETFRPPDKKRKTQLSRHYYDLWCLITKGIADNALLDPNLFTGIAEHRVIFFKQSWVKYDTLKQGSLRLLPQGDQIAAWRQDYKAMRTEMFFGQVPEFDEILEVVGNFEKKFNRL
jgi:hypothetical protein